MSKTCGRASHLIQAVFVFGIGAGLGTPCSAGAGPETVVPAPSSVGQPVPGSSAQASNGEAMQVIRQSLASYRSLRTYHDTLLHTFELRASFGSGGVEQPMDETQTQQARLVYARAAPSASGGRAAFSLTQTPLEVYSDRANLWLVAPESGEYIKRAIAADPGSDWRSAAGEFADIVHAHPVLEILENAVSSATGFPGLDAVTGVSDDNINGVPARRVDGMGHPGAMADAPDVGQAAVRAWFNKQSGLLMKMQIDLRPVYERAYAHAPAGARLNVTSATITMVFADVKSDADTDPSAFVYSPRPRDRMVSSLTVDSGSSSAEIDPRTLVGKTAPVLATNLLGGGEINLASLRSTARPATPSEGWTVVLCFWSATCEPCGRVLEQLNTLVDRYATDRDGEPSSPQGRKVMVLGVNQDPMAAIDRTRKYVNDRGLKMRHAMDPGGTAGRDFGATRLPLLVIVGPTGLVQRVIIAGDVDPKELVRVVTDEIEVPK